MDAQRRKILAMLDPILGALFVFLIGVTVAGIARGELGRWALLGPVGFAAYNIVISQVGLHTKWLTQMERSRMLVGPAVFLLHPYLSQGVIPVWFYYLTTSIGVSTNRYFYTQSRTKAYMAAIYWSACYVAHAAYWSLPGPWGLHVTRCSVIIGFGALVVELTRVLARALQNERAARSQAIGASKLSALGEMAGGIAYEINDPLTIVKTTASQMRDVLGDAELDKPLLKSMTLAIEEATGRMARVVEGMRVVARQGSRDPVRPVQVLNLVEQTLGLCREKLKSRGVELRVEGIPESLQFEGRVVELSQTLVNLLNNACDAVQHGKNPWIRITAREGEDHVDLWVDDSGPGVPEEIRGRVFQAFFTTKDRSAGLGLAVSLGAVQGLGGDLSIDPSRGCSSFRIRMPKKQGEERRAAA